MFAEKHLGINGNTQMKTLTFNGNITEATTIPSKDFNVITINSIEYIYPQYRNKSKAPTFLLTYKGGNIGLVRNIGFTKDEAIFIETQYHQLYKVSDEWVDARIEEAKVLGYVEVAFGLRLRTPLLKGAVGKLGSMQEAEARTAGNALGQSWGLLNDRAMNEVLSNVDKLGLSEYILPVAKVH